MNATPLTGIMLVGERGNYHSRAVLGSFWDVLASSAFRSGPSRKRLESIGLRWDLAVNLLPPAPTRDSTWNRKDREFAKTMASVVLEFCSEWGRVSSLVLLGGRVTESFDRLYDGPRASPLVPLASKRIMGIRCCSLPHPSGRNRFWNTRTSEAADWVRHTFPYLEGRNA